MDERSPWRAIVVLVAVALVGMCVLAAIVGALTGGDIPNPVLARITEGGITLTGWGWFVVWVVVVS